MSAENVNPDRLRILEANHCPGSLSDSLIEIVKVEVGNSFRRIESRVVIT